MTNYYILTEIKVNGKWICLNREYINIKHNEPTIAFTYYSGSRSYFHETAEKIEEIGCPLNFDDVSDVVLKKYGKYKDKEYPQLFTAYIEDMRKVIPHDMKHQYHGFVEKNAIFRYKSGDQEEIYESITPTEYNSLDEKAKQAYEYFEWDDEMGWFKYFKEILEHVDWQIYEWSDVNILQEYEDSRIVICIC